MCSPLLAKIHSASLVFLFGGWETGELSVLCQMRSFCVDQYDFYDRPTLDDLHVGFLKPRANG